ncbi:Uncharacterised protein [uncultured archaeon]|nr:Uncharacterised protein [uncultured archaeon]
MVLRSVVGIKEKIQQTCLNRYGATSPVASNEIQEKIKETNRQKYGVNYPLESPEILEKVKNTVLKKYKADSILKVPEIQERYHQIIKKKYGVDYPAQNSEIQKRTKNTSQARYGVKFATQRNYNSLAREILFDKEKFSKKLKEMDVPGLALYLNVSETTILNFHHSYDLNLIQSNRSLYEIEFDGWLKEHRIGAQLNNRILCSPCEIDFYIPEHHLAIEFDGLYWHSNYFKTSEYHLKKTEQCLTQGIHLIHIFEDEWKTKKNICKDIILRELNIFSRELQSNDCAIQEISDEISKKFLDENCLQGYDPSLANLGLLYKNELVCLLSFDKRNEQWEIIRFATKLGVKILGGHEKLWNYFIQQYCPDSVAITLDRRWFDGKKLKQLGFFLESQGAPICWLTDYNIRIPFGVIDANTNILGKIWDCGNDKWVWKSTKNQK